MTFGIRSPSVSSVSDSSEISDFEDFRVDKDKGYFTSSISSLMKVPEPRSCCCPSLREKHFPSLETKLFKIMQKEDFLPSLKKLRKSIKDDAKLQRFYVGLIPLIIDNPQIFYDVGIQKDVAVLSPLLAERIAGFLYPSEKVDFIHQLYKLEERFKKEAKEADSPNPPKPDLLEPFVTTYIQKYEDFELFEDHKFICIFHNKSCQLEKEALLQLIVYLEENEKLFECIEICTLAEVKRGDATLFRSTNLLSQITAVYGTQAFSPLLIRLEQTLVDFLIDVEVSEYQHENSEVTRLSKEQHRKSRKVVRKLEKDDFSDIFKKLTKKGFPAIEAKNKKFYSLVDMFISELFSHPFPEAGEGLLLQRKEILEKKGFDSKAVDVYLGELLFLRIINPRLTTMKIGEQRAVVLQLAKVLQTVANHITYEDFNHLSWMNPYLGEFSGKFDDIIANLEKSKKSKKEEL